MLSFKNLLDEILETKDINKIELLIKDHVASFFDSPYLATYYQAIKPYPLTSNEGKLVLAWLAFLSGDFMAHYQHVLSINFDDLKPLMKALYLDLKAISKSFGSLEERLVFSKESLKYIENDHTFFKANALAIHANLIYLKGEIRQATTYFEQAFDIFFKERLYFQAAVAISNALTNYMYLGEFTKVIDKTQHILLLTSEFYSDDKIYWEILYLPIGAVYMYMNKPSLALECLLKAEKAIDEMELVHMHGHLEIYLMKTYYLLKDMDQFNLFLNKTCELFSHTHIESIQSIIAYGKIISNHPTMHAEIERIEQLILLRNEVRPLVLETIAYLKNHHLSDVDFSDKMVDMMKKHRYSGNYVHLQTCLLQLAEYHYLLKNYQAAKILLEEAITYYHEKQIKSPFYMYDYACFPLITKMDKRIVKDDPVVKLNQPLTQRELEILILISQEKTNEEIGKAIYISEGTVKWHINHILSKLEVKNRLQAIDKARLLKIID